MRSVEIVSGIGVISPCGRVPCQDLYLLPCLLVCSSVYKYLSSLLSKYFLKISSSSLEVNLSPERIPWTECSQLAGCLTHHYLSGEGRRPGGGEGSPWLVSSW